MHWILTIPSDFLLSDVIQQSQRFLLPPFQIKQGQLERVEQLASGKIVAIAISQIPTGLYIETKQRITGSETEEISQKIRRMLRIGENFSDLLERAAEDPLLQKYLKRGVRLLRGTTFEEDISKALILGHAPAQGYRYIAQLVDRLGPTLPSNPTRHAYPTLDNLLKNSSITQEALGPEIGQIIIESLSYIKNQAAPFAERTHATVPTEVLKTILNKIPNMNDKALSLIMLALSHYDYVPHDAKVELREGQPWYNNDNIPPQTIHSFARWHPWEGLLYWLRECSEDAPNHLWGKEKKLVHGNAPN